MPKLVCPHCQQKVRIPSVDLNALANPAGIAKVRCPECKGSLVVPVPRIPQQNAVGDSATIATIPADASEHHARVRHGHLENFRRKLTSAENPLQLDRVISTIDAAVSRNMISAKDREVLMELIQVRRQDLSRY